MVAAAVAPTLTIVVAVALAAMVIDVVSAIVTAQWLLERLLQWLLG